MSSDQDVTEAVEDAAGEAAEKARCVFDDVEVGAALVGLTLVLIYGFGVVEDSAVLMLGLATVSSAVGLEQWNRRFRS